MNLQAQQLSDKHYKSCRSCIDAGATARLKLMVQEGNVTATTMNENIKVLKGA